MYPSRSKLSSELSLFALFASWQFGVIGRSLVLPLGRGNARLGPQASPDRPPEAGSVALEGMSLPSMPSRPRERSCGKRSWRPYRSPLTVRPSSHGGIGAVPFRFSQEFHEFGAQSVTIDRRTSGGNKHHRAQAVTVRREAPMRNREHDRGPCRGSSRQAARAALSALAVCAGVAAPALLQRTAVLAQVALAYTLCFSRNL